MPAASLGHGQQLNGVHAMLKDVGVADIDQLWAEGDERGSPAKRSWTASPRPPRTTSSAAASASDDGLLTGHLSG